MYEHEGIYRCFCRLFLYERLPSSYQESVIPDFVIDTVLTIFMRQVIKLSGNVSSIINNHDEAAGKIGGLINLLGSLAWWPTNKWLLTLNCWKESSILSRIH